ncbi:MFS transporter [Rhodococcus qingshengii]|uniref:MFS transporter n=1 Tax=Rhodococcus qingshengii TaxID=334542 RepID=UPI00279DD1EF|nr:MFS transporter [Rhodococcus qingshengii]
MTLGNVITAPRERLDRNARVVIALTFTAWLLSYADRQLVTLVLPLIGDDLDLDNTERGLLVSVFFLAYAATQIPAGLLADRFGAKRMAVIGIVAWSVFTILTGVVPGLVALLVVRFLFGIGEGMYPAASMKAIAEQTTPGQRMTANGWVLSSNAVGTLLAATVGVALVAALGWRHSFVVFGVVGFVVAAVIMRAMPAPRPASETATKEVAETALGRPRDLLRSWTMWRYCLMYFGVGTVSWGVSSWVPSYLYDVHGIDLKKAAALMAIPVVAAAVAIVAGGRLSDAVGGRHRVIVVPSMIVVAISLLVVTQVSQVAFFVAAVTVALFASSLCITSVFSVPSRSLPPHLLGAASGIIITGSQLAGIATPTIMGFLVDTKSYEVAFGYLITGAVLTALASLLTPQTTERFLKSLALNPRAKSSARESELA